MNTQKLQELYGQLFDLILFEASDASSETAFIEAEFDAWINEKLRHLDLVARLDALELKPETKLPFNENEVKALLAVANATLGSVPDEVVEEPSQVVAPVSKIRRGRKPKVQAPIPAVTTKVVKNDDDEFMNSEYPMKDPRTGQQMVDAEGKPLWLRVKKNPPKTVVPPGYSPPPGQAIINNMAMNEESIMAQKTRAFKVAGGLTMADLISHAKK